MKFQISMHHSTWGGENGPPATGLKQSIDELTEFYKQGFILLGVYSQGPTWTTLLLIKYIEATDAKSTS